MNLVSLHISLRESGEFGEPSVTIHIIEGKMDTEKQITEVVLLKVQVVNENII